MSEQSGGCVHSWEGLNPPYRTIVADPPWHYTQHGRSTGADASHRSDGKDHGLVAAPPYQTMRVPEIAALAIAALAAPQCHLYLWTTNKYLRPAFDILTGWGFKPPQVLVWAKRPSGIGPGGVFVTTTEFILFSHRDSLIYNKRTDSSWWDWPRGGHSVKPDAFFDLVETVSPGPYVELFARKARPGWDRWGYEAPQSGRSVQ